MTTQNSTFQVNFAPAPSYLFDYLIADIQTSECIFDLIDNSIDAARATIREDGKSDLPENYSGFEIALQLDPQKVVIEDNCSGIDEQQFTDVVFRTGMKSQHNYGIGHFGVGLKRAILKLGNRCKVITDNGVAELELDFTRKALDEQKDFQLPANKRVSSGRSFTRIEISDVPSDTQRDLAAIRWQDVIKENMGRRYGLFIKKGLSIMVNGQKIQPFAPRPVDNEYIPLQNAEFASHGVKIRIEAGVHESYRFGTTSKGNIGADPENLHIHKQIAKEYGWYIVCNDRVILLHDQSYKTGWTTNWHNEYSGFVGWVYFESENPELLPWNTKKTDIRENSEVYSDIQSKLQEFAQKYRQKTPLSSQRRKEAHGSTTGASSQKTSSPPTAFNSQPKKKSSTVTATQILEATATKRQIKALDTLLPPGLPVAFQQPQLAALVHEGELLVIDDFPYVSAILLRTIFDASIRDYLRRHGHFIQMRDDVFDGKLKEGQNPTTKERKNFSPPLADMITWCVNNSDIFPDPDARACKQACDNFKKHLKTLNGITHEEGTVSNSGQVRTMRDEVLQGLLHVLST